MKQNPTRTWVIRIGAAAGVLVLAALFLLRFSYSTSFLYPGYCGYDSAIFQTVGKYWAQGDLPYQALFDHKGPLIFLLDAIGYALHGRVGILVVQTVSLSIAMWGAYRLSRVWLNRPLSLAAVAMMLVYLARTFDEGNMTEEYSLPFLLVSLFLALRWFKKREEQGGDEHPWQYAAVYGLSFGAVLLLRVTSAVAVCCFVFVITVMLMVERRWKNLFANMAGFIGGFLAMVGPFSVYFAVHGAFANFFYGTIGYNIFYATEFSITEYYANNPWAANTLSRILLDFGAPLFLLAALCVLMLFKKPGDGMAWGGLLSALGSMYILFTNRPYVHYFMIAAPLVLLAAQMAARLWHQRSGRPAAGYAGAVLCGIWCISLLVRLPGWNTDSFMAKYPAEVQDYNMAARAAVSVIPKQERDSVLGFNVDAQWYLATDIKPCQSYFIHQDWQSAADQTMQQQIAQMFRDAPPKWVAASSPENPEVKAMLEQDYTAVSGPQEFNEYASYVLYQRNAD